MNGVTTGTMNMGIDGTSGTTGTTWTNTRTTSEKVINPPFLDPTIQEKREKLQDLLKEEERKLGKARKPRIQGQPATSGPKKTKKGDETTTTASQAIETQKGPRKKEQLIVKVRGVTAFQERQRVEE